MEFTVFTSSRRWSALYSLRQEDGVHCIHFVKKVETATLGLRQHYKEINACFVVVVVNGELNILSVLMNLNYSHNLLHAKHQSEHNINNRCIIRWKSFTKVKEHVRPLSTLKR